jgi:ribosomal protein L37AE/L43A
MKPYTYLIKHRLTGQVYYGVRSANKVDPYEDLWQRYYTSSPKVQTLIEETGKDSFDVEVRKIFETKEQAVAWEAKVLRRCKVLHDDRWINQNVAGYIIPTEESNKKISDYHKGKPKSEEHKKKIRNGNIGKKKPPRTDEYRALMSKLKSGEGNGRYGKEVSNETRQRISDAKKGKQVAHNKGVPMSEEQKEKIRATKLANPIRMSPESIAKRLEKIVGQKREKKHCPHCKRDIAVGWYHRHGDKCKHRTPV